LPADDEGTILNDVMPRVETAILLCALAAGAGCSGGLSVSPCVELRNRIMIKLRSFLGVFPVVAGCLLTNSIAAGAQFSGLDPGPQFNNAGFWDLPIPVTRDVEVDPEDVVIYDAPGYEPPAAYGAPAAAPAAEGGLSRTTLAIIVVAAVAVVAIVAVWFLFVRGTGGTSPFLGTWNEPNGGTATVEIKKKSGDFKVTMSGKDAAGTQKSYTIPAHLTGSSLEITIDDFITATGNEEQAAQAKAAFASMIRDFRLVFTLKDPTHLGMRVEGSPVGGSVAAQASNSSVVLVKDN
jgi:hypothetical protein